MKSSKKLNPCAIVFDWDDVVFNTAAFKKHLAAMLARQGIPRSVVLHTVSIAKDPHGYNPRIHARMITAAAGGNAEKITQLIWSACGAFAKELLFADAVRTIRAAHAAGIPLYVLSAGRRKFQEIRIYGSGLIDMFQKVFIVDVTDVDAAAETKIKVLQSLGRRYERILFLDDRFKTIRGVRRSPALRKKVVAILVWRSASEKPPLAPPVIRRLNWRDIKKMA